MAFDVGKTKKRHQAASSSAAIAGQHETGGGMTSETVMIEQHPVPPTIITTTPSTDDADVAAGNRVVHKSSMSSTVSSNTLSSLETAPTSSHASVCTINTNHGTDLEFFEDLITEPVLVLGVDISHLNKQAQFAVCACGLFFFSLLYGYLQELLSVELCSRQLGLFLAMMQFSGYTVLAYILRNFVYSKQQKHQYAKQQKDVKLMQVPLTLYVGLSLLRAVDLAMTNLAMQFINYPAKVRAVFCVLLVVCVACPLAALVQQLTHLTNMFFFSSSTYLL